jgi:hypothetical protein
MIRVPLMNPIRFYNPNIEPDYTTYWPNPDNYIQRTKYIEGITPANYYKDFIINKEITIQLWISEVVNTTLKLYKPNGTTQILTGVDISPVGWVSETVYKYSFTPTLEGEYYLKNEETEIISDVIYVQSQLKYKKRLVYIEYQNSENDYGMVFWDELTEKFKGKTYFTGRLMWAEPKNEISAFTTDRGNVEILRSTPVRTANLELTEIHFTYIDNINMIFSCDTISVNGMNFQTVENPKIELTEKSDIVNITIQLSLIDNDYFAKIL